MIYIFLGRYAHPELLTAERLMSLPEVGLYEARGFLYHSIGCNALFTGSGTNATGQAEYICKNGRVADIEGVEWLELEVTAEEIRRLEEEEAERACCAVIGGQGRR